ncbi:hypothetical protein Pla110_10490 [Polystyrenella longa]|uniref:Uncharacterized protein n=1 Tax=Polystyrenella longa TaxID=2528007 RepID=A0A518CJD6_9PLAN|nr:hypothetical protein Pla110_10490 [Polystyrenella longa]
MQLLEYLPFVVPDRGMGRVGIASEKGELPHMDGG